MARLIILDFDGTITDAEQEGKPFTEAVLKDLALLTGLPLEEVRERANTIFDKIAEDPASYNWFMIGDDGEERIACSACVDPYLRSKPVIRTLLFEHGFGSLPPERLQALHELLYIKNYPKSDRVFRPGADSLLLHLYFYYSGSCYIVTNSKTDAVIDKLSHLKIDDEGADTVWQEHVHGYAKKYQVEGELDGVPESLAIPGLHRPVLLRRKKYHDLLVHLMKEADVDDWKDVVVIGDIFELDLALPLAMGATVILVGNKHTPPHEIRFLASHERGHVVTNLKRAQKLIESL